MYFRLVCCYATICCYFFFIICFDFSPVWCNHKWFVNEMFLWIWSAAEAHKSIYLHEWFGYTVVKMIEISSLMKTNPIEMWFKLMCFYCLHLICNKWIDDMIQKNNEYWKFGNQNEWNNRHWTFKTVYLRNDLNEKFFSFIVLL